MTRQRIESIDAVKGASIIAVVLIHTAPFVDSSEHGTALYYLSQFIQQACSFAVPFFFVAAGYLFSLNLTSTNAPTRWRRYAARLFLVLMIWIIIDGTLSGKWLNTILDFRSLSPLLWNLLAIPSFALKRPDLFFFRGTSVSLWFLISLLLSSGALVALVMLRVHSRAILVVGIGAYAIALFLGAYAYLLPLTDAPVLLEQRGPLIGFGFFALGYYFANRPYNSSLNRTVLTLCLLLPFAEAAFQSAFSSGHFQEQPYIVSTFLSVGALFVYSIQHRSFGARSLASKLGTNSLGIYLFHIPMLGALATLRPFFHGYSWDLLIPILTIAGSYLLAVKAAETPYLRRVVT